MRRIAISLCLIGVLGVGAASCGSSGTSSSPTTTGASATSTTSMSSGTPTAGLTEHNDADVAFAERMIPHHQQALTMALMALDARAGASDAVKALATKINGAQTPEIKLMQGWLNTWAAPASATTVMQTMGSSPVGTSMTMTGADGMMSDVDMHAMAAATGPAFDKLWLTGMIAHHQGAITMAATEKQSGMNQEALALAASIASGQTAEVTEMQQMLGAG
jgi:uncharacterized protein (DUF305 family)